MPKTLGILIDEQSPPIEVDLEQLKATIAIRVRKAIHEALESRLGKILPEQVMAQWDVHLNYDHLSWLGGTIEWDCLLIVDSVKMQRHESLRAGVAE